MKIDLTGKMDKAKRIEFVNELLDLSDKIGFKVSSRGWCYQLESEGLITKAEFNKVETLINKCRKEGILPIDFIAEEEGRQFSGVETPSEDSPIEDMRQWIAGALNSGQYYTPDWWDGEEYYIQMVVEKIDLKTLFKPVCEKYHIAIATSKGWSSMLQRAIYSKRYTDAEKKGLTCVLLYGGDHDPDGLRIAQFIKKNLEDLKDIQWENGDKGYDPKDLEIVRFGLDADFIEEHNITWIDNLITGSGKDLANPNHRNYNLPYLQNYIKTFGIKKCEANAIIPMPKIARELVENAITNYIGIDAESRFIDKHNKILNELEEFREKTGLDKALRDSLKIIDSD